MGAEVRGESPVLRPPGSPAEPGLGGWRGRRDVSELAYLASRVNTNLQSLSREEQSSNAGITFLPATPVVQGSI